MTKKQKRNIYQEVTDTIVEAIETGNIQSWIRPWAQSGAIFPKNFVKGNQYRGVNILLLWYMASLKGYEHHLWATFKQIKSKGGSVLKGEKSSEVIFWNVKEKEVGETIINGDGKEEVVMKKKKSFILRYYRVFNIAQTDLNIADFVEPVETDEFKIIENAEKYIANIPHDVRHGQGRAFYNPARDFIGLPNKEDFTAPGHYYSTHAHELGHWSGSKSRLNRDLSGRFGDESYAMEELVAELSSAFVCAQLGIDGELQHKDYVANWLKVLKDDNKAVFTAASKAQCVVDYLDKFQEQPGKSEDTEPASVEELVEAS